MAIGKAPKAMALLLASEGMRMPRTLFILERVVESTEFGSQMDF